MLHHVTTLSLGNIVIDKFYSILENIEFVCSFDCDKSK